MSRMKQNIIDGVCFVALMVIAVFPAVLCWATVWVFAALVIGGPEALRPFEDYLK
jgi:hypothetical protein